MSGRPTGDRRSSLVVGTAFGALVACGLVCATGAGLYLRTRNQGELALARAPSAAYARALAREVTPADGPGRVQAFAEKLQRNAAGVKRAVVVVEPRSSKYRFLRKRRYLAHSLDPSRVRGVLDRRHESDKQIYDLANQVRRGGRQVEASSEAGQPLRVSAAEPIRRGGRHYAMALVDTEPIAPAGAPPAWPLGLALVAAVAVAGLAGAVSRRFRYVVVMGATAAAAVVSYRLLETLRQFYANYSFGPVAIDGKSLAIATDGVQQATASFGGRALVPVTLVALGLGLLGLLGIGGRIARALKTHRFALAYVLPAALGMLILVFVPFGYGLGLGFFNHAHGSYTFVGLSNFVEILSGGGRPLSHPLNFYFTLGVTVLWTAVNVVLHVVIGLSLALVLKDPLLRFKGIYRVLLILPWAVPNYITALIWKGMFHQQYGAVNHVLSMVGIEKVSWFSEFSTAFCANVVTNTWLGFPFMMVVSLGALQSIPDDVYEAASVDGATRWQSFWQITLPLLRPALFPAIVIGSIWTFNMFNIIYLVSGGAPGGASDILITEAYRWAFERADRYGLAAAYALIILVILTAYTLITNRLTRATEDAYS